MRKLLFLLCVLFASPSWAQSCVVPPTANFGTSPVSVGTTATLIAVSRCRNSITIFNAGSATVYFSNTNAVSTAVGMPLGAGAAVTLQTNSAVWGIAGTAQTVGVTETF